MKIKGKVYNSLPEDVVVIPRKEGDVVFKIRAVIDREQSHLLDPIPRAPMMQKRIGGSMQTVPNFDDPVYKHQLEQWGNRQTAWMNIKALEGTEGLEWETVDMQKPETWPNYLEELRKGFTDNEIMHVALAISNVNGLNEANIAEARNRFLLGQHSEPNGSLTSQKEGPKSTSNGESKNASVSNQMNLKDAAGTS